MFEADASCAGVSEEHRQAVAHRYTLCLQWRQCGEVPELQVCVGPTGDKPLVHENMNQKQSQAQQSNDLDIYDCVSVSRGNMVTGCCSLMDFVFSSCSLILQHMKLN